MTINLNQAGIYKARNAAVGILWAAESSEFNAADITDASTPLPAYFWDCGAVSQEGVSISENATEGDAQYDFAGNVVEVSEATAAPTISFKPLEAFSENTLKLLYSEDAVSVDGDLTIISGTANPTNKTIVIDLKLKNNNVRIVWPETSLASRGDESITSTDLAGQEITYNVLTPGDGLNSVYRYSEKISAPVTP